VAWSNSLVRITASQSVSGNNTLAGPVAVDPLGTGLLAAGRWLADLKLPIMAAPTVATVGGDETVFVGLDNGELRAYKARGGTPVYTVQEGIGAITRRPTFKDNFIYLTSTTGGVVKVDAATGKAVWTVATLAGTGGAARHPTTSPSVATDGGKTSVYVGTQEGFVVKLDDTNGALLVETDVKAPVSADPAAGAQSATGPVEVWVGAGNQVIQLDANLTPKKSFTAGGVVSSPPFISPIINGVGMTPTRLVSVGSSDGKLYVFNTGTGAELGSYDSGSPITAASYVDWPSGNLPPTVYLVNTKSEVHAVSLANLDLAPAAPAALTGKLVASYRTNANTALIAVGSPRFAYYSTQDGAIAALKLPDVFGNPTPIAGISVDAGYPALSPSAAVGAKALLVTTGGGVVLALPILPEGTVGQ
jgi:outer membrane protein assembly factor BamB